MRTVQFKQVLHGAAIRTGLEPDVNLLSNQAMALVEYLNDEVQGAWERFDWAEITYVEQRFYRYEYDAGTAYVVGNEIYYAAEDTYYICILNSTGNVPTNTTYWEELTSFNRYIDLEQTGETVIGEVFNLYQRDPFLYRNPGRMVPALSRYGIQVPADAGTSVYVEFRLRPPRFTHTAWDAAVAYIVDDLVYYATTGECYISIQAGTNKNPSSQTAYWTKIDFPYFLSRYVREAVYACTLEEDGQHEKAGRIRAKAEHKLMDEFDKITMQQQQLPRYSVRTS
jgi:hypothetical protein